MRAILLFALALVALAGCGRPASLPPATPAANLRSAEELQAGVAELLLPLLGRYRVPGASVAIVVDREVVLASGFGRVRAEEGAPAVDETTVFQAASLSKPVVAWGALRLMAERPEEVDLDRPLASHRPPDEPYRHGDPRLERITPRMVLSHTTGFPNWRGGFWSDEKSPLKIGFEPGSRFRYSGEGFVYLQRVMERITGETLDVFLRRSVLEPLGMRDSSFVWEERFEAAHAAPHDDEGRTLEKQRPASALAAGTLHTTAADYARFLQGVLGEGPTGDGGAWLERASTIDDSLGWALGWGFEEAGDGDLFWQWGDDGPFKALVAGSHERGLAVVVFTNGERGLNVARPVFEWIFGPGRKFLDFRMLDYG